MYILKSSEVLQVHVVLSVSLHLSVFPALAAEGGMVMFNACGLCCTQCWRMGSSPLISNKRSLETRQAQHRSTSSKVWSDVDTDVCPGPFTVCSWASHLLTESQWVQHWAHSALNYLFGMPILVAACACIGLHSRWFKKKRA